jgi:diaminopimelate decarboxylase
MAPIPGTPGVPGFTYRNGALHVEDVPLARIAEAVGTPAYVYSTAALEQNYRAYAEALAGLDATICYALKANGNLAVIRTLARLGAGADVVSEGELRRALAAGVPAGKIVFSGVGKTRAEMAFALDAGIAQINVESEPELDALSEVAAARGKVAPVALRVNPDVDAGTHDKISTGRKENKFGIETEHALEIYARAQSMPGIRPVGLAVHIGSQLTDLGPYRAAFERIAALVRRLRADGHKVSHLDLGGGLGIVYDRETPPAPADYGAVVREVIGPLGCAIAIEPGRSLVGNAGVLLTRVIYVKDGTARRFVIVDAAMNDLARPTLYDAYHDIVTVAAPPAGAASAPVDVVGPVCETGDTFAVGRVLPPVASGDLLAIMTAGAYGAVMASTYNARLLAPEVLVAGDRFATVRPRQDYDSLLGLDAMPPWLTDLSGRQADPAASAGTDEASRRKPARRRRTAT